MSANPLTAGQVQCVSDAGVAVNAIGAPEAWAPGWQPAPTWQQFRDTVERAIACWGHYDSEQIADMRAGVARSQACYPCNDQRVTISGPCAPPLPSVVARNLAAGIDPNPPVWAGCGPPKPLSYWQSYAAGVSTGFSTPGAPVTPWSQTVGEAPVQPTESITGPGAPVVTLNPDGTTSVVQPSTPGSSGGSLPGATGPGTSIPPAASAIPASGTSATASGPFTSILSGLFAHPYLLLAGGFAIWFLFFRGKR